MGFWIKSSAEKLEDDVENLTYLLEQIIGWATKENNQENDKIFFIIGFKKEGVYNEFISSARSAVESAHKMKHLSKELLQDEKTIIRRYSTGKIPLGYSEISMNWGVLNELKARYKDVNQFSLYLSELADSLENHSNQQVQQKAKYLESLSYAINAILRREKNDLVKVENELIALRRQLDTPMH